MNREGDSRGEMTEDEAMTAYARGDATAFEIVYDAVAPRLEGYLRKQVRESARVDDIVQQTFLQMHAARGSFIPGAGVLPWAFAIARRLMIDHQRRNRREESRDLGSEADEHGRTLASREASGEEIAVARETHERVAAAYEQLSEPQRRAFELRDQGLSCAETATALGTTVTGVKLRMHRALQALRNALRDGE